jgi:glycosyltransferase involved in cell wall biosynthesis
VRVAAPVASGEGGGPLVSCLMPTADRRRFVPHAIDLFLRQDYPARELVIVDDGRDAVQDLVPDDPRIRYVRAERSPTLGAKRNLACSLARGDLLAHWDDDDWASDARLSIQVAALQATGAEVCGLSVVRFFEPESHRAWEYRWTEENRPWVAGATLFFRRKAWERHPFPALNVGEDTRWVWSQSSVHAIPDPSFFAALVHPRNTSRKQVRGSRWHPIPLSIVQDAMGADWGFYESTARQPAGIR